MGTPLLILLHVVDDLHQFLAKFVGLGHRLGLAVYTDNRLCVRLAEVNPAVGEVDLHAVDIVDDCRVVLGKHLFDFHKDGVNISLWSEVDAVLGNLVVRECLAQL